MSTHRISGFTLIEVLVAVLVLSFGVIGSAAMQLAALRTRNQSSLLSNAAQLGASMQDSMRANAGQMQASDVDNAYLGLDYAAQGERESPGFACFGVGANCDSAQLANVDIAHWKRQLRSSLPSGRVVICRDDQAWNGVRIAWHCSGNPAAPIVIKLGWIVKRADGGVVQDGAHDVMLVMTLTGSTT